MPAVPPTPAARRRMPPGQPEKILIGARVERLAALRAAALRASPGARAVGSQAARYDAKLCGRDRLVVEHRTAAPDDAGVTATAVDVRQAPEPGTRLPG